MNVKEAINRRRSVRSYRDKEVSEEKLDRVLNAARMAPSARNKQDWKFVVVQDEETKEKVYEAAHSQNSVRQAPVVIAGVSTDPENVMSCGIPSGVVDLSIALDHITLAAAEEGLGTCWIGAFEQDEAKEALNVPEGCEIVSLMTLGYPEGELSQGPKNRKDLDDVVSYDSYY